MAEKMTLPSATAERVADLILKATGFNANVMGEGGRIVASSDPARVGSIHEGARKIMAGETDEIAVSSEKAASMQGVRPGYNGVVFYRGERIACIGISGDPEVVKPLQKMAAIVLIQELDRLSEESRSGNLIREVEREIADIAERMLVLSLNGSVIAARAGENGKGFKIVVEEMRRLASQIGERIAGLERKYREN